MRIKIYLLVITLVIGVMLISCNKNKTKILELSEAYYGQTPPGTVPEIFAPGIVSLPQSIESAPAISPDGNELYFTRFSPMENKRGIMVTRKKNGVWSEAETASFSGEYQDGEAFISQDGARLYFSSNRPLEETGELQTGDIWYVDRTGSGWSDPVNIGSPVNSDDREMHPSVTKSGTIYFHVSSDDGYDIYRSRLIDGKYQEREKLSDAINTKEYIEGEPAIAPDESYLLFISAGRQDRIAENDKTCDLYISFKNDDESWTKAKCLGDNILSKDEENWPWVSPDGKYIFYSSNRNSKNFFPDIYWVDAKVIEELRPDAKK